MKRSGELYARIQQFVETLAQETDQAKTSEQMLAYLSFAAKFHRYSLHNSMLIFLQCPQATHVAGYQTWRQMGRQVRQGEKGIAILAPMLCKRDPTSLEDEPNETTILRFRTVYVFDVSQTEGDDLPDCSVLTHAECAEELVQALLDFAQTQSIQVEEGQLPGETQGASYGGRIVLSRELAGADRFAVLVHELAHELLNHREHREEIDKKTRELEAETVAYVVCRHVGVSSTAPNYLALYGVAGEEITKRLQRLTQTIHTIIHALESHLDQPAAIAACM